MGQNGKAGPLDRVAWCDRPPDTGPESLRVLSPEPGKPLEIVVCTLSLVACWLHWVGGRSLPCLAGRGPDGAVLPCPDKLHRHPVRWKGYLGGITGRARTPCIAQVTYEAARRCPDLLEAHQQRALRGRVLRLVRQDGHRQARVSAELSQHPVAVALPNPPDVRAALYRMWWADPLLHGLSAPPSPDEEGGGE